MAPLRSPRRTIAGYIKQKIEKIGADLRLLDEAKPRPKVVKPEFTSGRSGKQKNPG